MDKHHVFGNCKSILKQIVSQVLDAISTKFLSSGKRFSFVRLSGDPETSKPLDALWGCPLELLRRVSPLKTF